MWFVGSGVGYFDGVCQGWKCGQVSFSYLLQVYKKHGQFANFISIFSYYLLFMTDHCCIVVFGKTSGTCNQ